LIPFILALAISTPDDRLPSRDAAEVGMSAERLANIDRVVRRGISGGGFPGAAVVVGRDGYSVLRRGYGRLEWTTTSPIVSPEETIYDLASLTKVVATTTAAMILFDEGRLPLDAPVRQFIPAFSGGNKNLVTVRHLLTHHSGLPAGRAIWGKAATPADARRLILETPLNCAPGKCFTYSDLGPDILGWIVEAVSGESLDAFVSKRVFGPLNMSDTHFRPAANLRPRIAPTAHTSRRGYALRGEVHDETSFLLGGVAGHAGLFSNASDLAIFAQMMLNRGVLNGVRIVADSTVEIFTSRSAGSRALGWEKAEKVRGAGNYLSERAYGHTGFTGTSMWIDPERKMFVILLTNRVYAPRARRPAQVISDVRNDLADATALAIVGDELLAPHAMPRSFRSDTASIWNRPIRPTPKKRTPVKPPTKLNKASLET